MKSMNKNLRTFLGFSRWGTQAILPTLFALTLVCVLSVSSARADVTVWSDFSANTGAGPYSPTSGSDFSGATLSVSGTHTGGSTLSFAANSADTLTFTLTSSDTVSLTALSYTYNYSGSGFPNIDWVLHNTTDSNSHDYGPTAVFNGSDVNVNLDLTIGGADTTGQSFTLTGTLGGPGDGSNITFTQFSITAVPEPVNYALAGFGLVFIVGSVGLTLRRKLSAAKTA